MDTQQELPMSSEDKFLVARLRLAKSPANIEEQSDFELEA